MTDYDNPSPLDLASFYVEELRFGASHPDPSGLLIGSTTAQFVGELEVLARAAEIKMTGDALSAGVAHLSQQFAGAAAEHTRLEAMLYRSAWGDGFMHGVALAAGLQGEPRNPR